MNPIWGNPTLEELITAELHSNVSIDSNKDSLSEGKEQDEDFFSEPLTETKEIWDEGDEGSTDNKLHVIIEALKKLKNQR